MNLLDKLTPHNDDDNKDISVRTIKKVFAHQVGTSDMLFSLQSIDSFTDIRSNTTTIERENCQGLVWPRAWVWIQAELRSLSFHYRVMSV